MLRAFLLVLVLILSVVSVPPQTVSSETVIEWRAERPKGTSPGVEYTAKASAGGFTYILTNYEAIDPCDCPGGGHDGAVARAERYAGIDVSRWFALDKLEDIGKPPIDLDPRTIKLTYRYLP